MQSCPKWVIAAASMLAACSVDLSAGDAIITCGPKGECPDTYSCDPDINRCVQGATDRPVQPTLTLASVRPASGVRFVDVVGITFNLDDRNIPTGDRVDVRFEFSVGAASDTWFPATAADGPIDDISERNFQGTYGWNALADATAGVAGLAVDPAGFVAFVPEMRIRGRATDQSGLNSTFAVSEVFAVGNSLAAADLRPFERESYAGLLAIQLNLLDEAQDDVTIEVDFRYRDDATWRRCDIAADLVTQVPTTPEGNLYLVAWRTETPFADDPTTPQGIGRLWADDVELRARAVDRPEGTTDYPGPWSASRAVGAVRNQTPPTISQLEVQRVPGMSGTGRFALTYVLTDAEGDNADLRVEISADGETWTAATEYPSPISEGVLDLAAAPEQSDGNGGVRHVFMIDPAGSPDLVQRRVRIIATDGFPPDAPLTTLAEIGVGEVGSSYGYGTTLLQMTNPMQDVVLGNFTGGTALDVASLEFGNLYIYTGNGNGTITFPATYTRAAGTNPTALVVGKLDGDAFDDVASIDTNGNQLRVYLSNQGTPYAPVTYATGAQPAGITIGRFNNDAHLDLAVTSVGSSDVRTFYGSATGAFTAGQTLAPGAAARGIDAADLDADGHVDLVATSGNNVAIYFGDGSGVPFASSSPLITNHSGANQLVIGDFDGDGAPDIAVAFKNDSLAVIYRNSGARAFPVLRVLPVAELSDATPGAHAADVDGDGRAELMLLGSSNLFIVGGDKIAQGFITPATFDTGIAPNGVATADLNADGQLDIVVSTADPSDEQMGVYLSTTSPYVGNAGIVTVQTETIFAPSPVATGDFNLDGVADLAVASEPSSTSLVGRVGILRGRATNSAAGGLFDTVNVVSGGGEVKEMVIVDLNLDAYPDVAVMQGDPPVHLTVYQNNGDSTYGQTFDRNVGGNGDGLKVADFNRDGIPDLIAANSASAGANLYLGSIDAATWSGAMTPLSLGFAPNDIVVGDFDGDGNTDFGGMASTSLAIRRGNGTGAFQVAQTTTLAGANWLSAAVGDVNDDGRDDVFVVAVGASVLLTAQSTPGTFATTTLGTTSQASVVSGDRNNDGVTDFVSLSNGGQLATTYFTTRGTVLGTGVFTVFTLAQPDVPTGAVIADLDGDGTSELATAIGFTNQVQVHWDRDEKPKPRSGTSLTGVGDITPVSSRWSSSNGSVLGRSLVTTSTVRDSVVRERLPAGFVRRFLVPVTAAERIVGDVELQRVQPLDVTIGAQTGPRLRVAARLGSLDPSDAAGLRRIGLDLTATPPRGVIVELPLLPGRAGSVGDGSSVRVFIGAPDWLRASEHAEDPLTAVPNAGDYLPRARAQVGYRDIVVERTEWLEVSRDPTGLSSGSETGSRFEVDNVAGVVRVLTDRLGHMQAYLDTSP